jgi:hypothetical protein
MTRPRLGRSIPFLVLIIASAASVILGVWISVSKLATMVAGLAAQTATTGDVYGGQSWVVLGSALVGAGLVGLFGALAIAALRAFVPAAPTPEAVTAVEEPTSAFADLDEAPASAVVTPAPAGDDGATAVDDDVAVPVSNS